MKKPTLENILTELNREQKTRMKVYPRFIHQQKLTPDKANERFSMIQKLMSILSKAQKNGFTIEDIEKYVTENIGSQPVQKELF